MKDSIEETHPFSKCIAGTAIGSGTNETQAFSHRADL